jgi:hypothetical protein
MGAGPPEAASEVVGEEQRVMAALPRQQGQSLLGAGPDRLYMGQEPTAELESVKLSLIEQQSQHLFPIHFTNPSSKMEIQGLSGASMTPQIWRQQG